MHWEDGGLFMQVRRAAHRYPRPGERIAPATLRAVLQDYAPQHLVGGTSCEGSRLADLDETVWEKLDVARIEQLAELVVARVGSNGARKVLEQRHFPRPAEGTRLSQLPVEQRTRLCLAREGFEADPGALGDRTIGEILAIRSFGPRCLVDLLSALEAEVAQRRRLYRPLTAEAESLAQLPEAALATRDDPRFAPLIGEVDPSARTAAELATRLLARTADPPDPPYAAAQLRELRQRILSLDQWTLEEELKQIFAATSNARNRDIVIGYYGWNDGQCHTLAEIGARYGMTRERTRQICAKLVRRKNADRIPAPVLDRTLAWLQERLPCSVAAVEDGLRQAGLTRIGLRIEQVQTAAELLGRPVPFRVVSVGKGRLAVEPSHSAIPAAVVEAAKKEIYYHGLGTIDQLVENLRASFGEWVTAPIVVETVQLMEGFRWLDAGSGWFRLESVARHGVPKAIEKVLAVAGRVRLGELAAAITRNRRLWKTSLPEHVLLEFCRQSEGIAIRGEWIVSEPPRPWQAVLTGVEAQLVAVLKEHGPVMDRASLEDLCVARGMNRFSFHAFLATSPVIMQYGPSVYGLVGTEASAETVRSLVAQHRAQRAPGRVLDSYGRTQDGRIWLSYRLSKAASTYAVVTVPAGLKDLICGKFDLLTPEGRHVGILAAKEGRAWGLGSFLRQQGAQRDDYVTLTFDLATRRALIALDGDRKAEPRPVRSPDTADAGPPACPRGTGAEGIPA